MGGNSKNSNPKFTRERQIFHYTFLFDAYDRPHSQDKIKRPNIGQVAPEPELKQPGQPSGRLQKETQVKRPSIQNYTGNKDGSAMKTGMRGRHTEKTPLKASRIHSDGFKIKK